jgi:NAD-dependent dihydropyrimidine dehydrogenase PreA subunit
MSVIYWFSGTGNSLFAAKFLAAEIGAKLYPVASGAPFEAAGGSGEKVGFVFPSYYCNMPRVVRRFAENLNLSPDTYTFAVVTMGGLGQGALGAFASALKKRGARLDYGRCVRMPGNYVMLYDPPDPNKSAERLDEAKKNLSRIAADIKAGERSVKAFYLSLNRLYKNIESLDKNFYAEDACTSCGLCEKACPVNNIRMDNGKPRWLGRCEHCVTCVSWCPAEAIQYGDVTKSRRRYRNPEVKLGELLV